MSHPLLSIVVNNFNYARFLGVALGSALGHDYPNIEAVIVNDGSTDESWKVITGFGGWVILILKKNGGQALAFNASVAASRGEVLSFLDADDFFHPEKARSIADTFRTRGLEAFQAVSIYCYDRLHPIL
jgi:glycosyltransferase involved in cell wall biosynthesis